MSHITALGNMFHHYETRGVHLLLNQSLRN